LQIARRVHSPLRRGRRAAISALIACLLLAQSVVAPAAALTPQTITFELPASEVVGSAIDLSATASSGLPVTFSVSTPSICSVSGIVLSMIGAGTCTVTASQAGDPSWAAAPDVQASTTVDAAPPPPPADPDDQMIDFSLPGSAYVGATVSLTATATSGREVAYVVTTPSVCATDGVTLALDATGICTVEASQAGDVDWNPAPTVARSTSVTLSPFVTSDGANLGRYALNGPIQSMVIDPETGITYVGGTFTEIGVRTGSISHVNAPDSGNDSLRDASPDAIGSQLSVYPHNDSGYFIDGHLASLNGINVLRDGVTRMTTSGNIDASWSLRTTCGTTTLPDWARMPVRWDLGDTLVANIGMAATASGDSTIGLAFIDKATGVVKRTGAGDGTCGSSGRIWPSTPVFSPLTSCAAWAVCVGSVTDVVKDPGSNSLLVAVGILRGQTVDTQELRQTWLIAYDLTSGSRRWAVRLESSTAPVGFPATADWGGSISRIAGLGGGILVAGRFPIEPTNRPADRFTSTMLINPANGVILQRWNRLGEQDVADPLGTEIAPQSACEPVNDSSSSYERWRFVARSTTHSIGYGQAILGDPDSTSYPVCDYSVTGSGPTARLAAVSIGTLAATRSPDLDQPLPSALYAGHVLVGPFDAFDLDTGAAVSGWHPSPSSGSVTLAVAGASVVIVGEATFVKGQDAFHVAALDRDLAPVVGFQSGLFPPPSDDWFRGLVLANDRLVLAGRFWTSEGRSHLVALDKATGAVEWTASSASGTHPFSITVDPTSQALYVGFDFAPGSAIKRYLPTADGFTPDDTFAPTLLGLGGAWPHVTALSWIDGRLYAGGQFSSVDGQAREGLARFGTDGILDGWAPKLVKEMGAPAGAPIEIVPIAFQEVGDKTVVTGRFNYYVPVPGGGGSYTYGPPGVRIYASTSGALIRPLDKVSWFGSTYGDWGYGMDVLDDVLYVAFGSSGIIAFDATTFDYLPFLSIRTFPGWGGNAIYDVSARPAAPATAGLATAAAPDLSLVVGGQLSNWKAHTASNVLELGQGALSSDRSAPSTSAVTDRPRTGAFVGGAAPWTIAWSGKDTGGAGVARYELARSLNGGAWTMVDVNVKSTASSVVLRPASTYRFRVRAIDRVGNIGAWAYGVTFKVSAVSQASTSVRYGGSWSPSTSSTWWGGTAKSSSAKGSTAAFTFSGRSVSWVSLKAPSRGKAYVYVNGVLKATVDLYASTTLKQRVVWSASYSTSATRTVTIKVLGTSGRPRVDVDGFVVRR